MPPALSREDPPAANPGVHLGVVLGLAANAGRDKVSLIASEGVAEIGAWLEQLLAESTGKHGKGLIPVDAEPLGDPKAYGSDRVFAYLRLDGTGDPEHHAEIAALEKAGQPVIRLDIVDTMQLGQAFFIWELATAVANCAMRPRSPSVSGRVLSSA